MRIDQIHLTFSPLALFGFILPVIFSYNGFAQNEEISCCSASSVNLASFVIFLSISSDINTPVSRRLVLASMPSP